MKALKTLKALFTLILTLGLLTACTSKPAQQSAGNTAKSAQVDSKKKVYRSLDEIKKSGKIVIGVFSDKNPFGYVDEKGKYQGYDIWLANRLAKDLGVKVEYVSTEAANRAKFLQTGKVDITLANFTVTDDRKKVVDFALPYMKVSLGVVSPTKQLISSVDQLKGKTLIVAKGTTADVYFSKNHPEVKLQKYDQYTEAYNALLDGRGDAFSTDNTEVLAWAIKNKGYKVGIESLGDTETIAPAVAKGNESLLNYINDEIKKLGKENFFHEGFDKTLKPVYGDTVKADSLVVEGGKLE